MPKEWDLSKEVFYRHVLKMASFALLKMKGIDPKKGLKRVKKRPRAWRG